MTALVLNTALLIDQWMTGEWGRQLDRGKYRKAVEQPLC